MQHQLDHRMKENYELNGALEALTHQLNDEHHENEAMNAQIIKFNEPPVNKFMTKEQFQNVINDLDHQISESIVVQASLDQDVHHADVQNAECDDKIEFLETKLTQFNEFLDNKTQKVAEVMTQTDVSRSSNLSILTQNSSSLFNLN